jgi:cytochrome c oxidase cbb3-type subunit 2
VAFDIHTSHRTLLLLPAAVFVGLVLLVAVFPAMELAERYPDPQAPADPVVARGEHLFRSLGCSYCHTRQIRGDESLTVTVDDRRVVPVLPADRRFGLDEPSVPEEYAGTEAPSLGTQRTGPDLTGVGDRLPDVRWHLWHFHSPRVVSPDSVMPAFGWLFHGPEDREEGDVQVDVIDALGVKELWATPDAMALAEYMISLRRRTRP